MAASQGATTVATELVTLGGHELEILVEDDQVWCSVRRACEELGLSYPRQFRKLEEADWATVALKATVAADGKVRETVMIEHRCIPMWMTTIHPSRVGQGLAPEAREALREALRWWQIEARELLADHVFGSRRPNRGRWSDLLELHHQEKNALASLLKQLWRGVSEARRRGDREAEARTYKLAMSITHGVEITTVPVERQLPLPQVA